jgi:hypothetical protein
MAGVTTGVKIFVRHLGETLVLPTPADGSVTTSKLGINSVDGTKIAMGSDAQGDILYHGATDYARLAKGTAGQALVMNSGATAPEWGSGLPTAGVDGQVLTSDGTNWASEAAAGGGKVLACNSTVVTARPSSTSASWVDVSGFAVTTGTLASSSSKILIFCQMVVGTTTTYHSNAQLKITPAGGSAVYPYKGTDRTDGGDTWKTSMFVTYAHSATSNNAGGETMVFLYQASSTVAHTLQIMWRVQSGATMYLNRPITDQYGHGVSSITYQEIGA